MDAWTRENCGVMEYLQRDSTKTFRDAISLRQAHAKSAGCHPNHTRTHRRGQGTDGPRAVFAPNGEETVACGSYTDNGVVLFKG